jgi:hypothetical protein
VPLNRRKHLILLIWERDIDAIGPAEWRVEKYHEESGLWARAHRYISIPGRRWGRRRLAARGNILAVAAGEEAALRFVQTSWAIFTDGPLNILTHSFFSGKDLSKNKKMNYVTLLMCKSA